MEDPQQHNLTENDAASYGSADFDPAVYSDGHCDPNVSGSLDTSAKQPKPKGDVFFTTVLVACSVCWSQRCTARRLSCQARRLTPQRQ